MLTFNSYINNSLKSELTLDQEPIARTLAFHKYITSTLLFKIYTKQLVIFSFLKNPPKVSDSITNTLLLSSVSLFSSLYAIFIYHLLLILFSNYLSNTVSFDNMGTCNTNTCPKPPFRLRCLSSLSFFFVHTYIQLCCLLV